MSSNIPMRGIRINEELWEAIKQIAKEENRTANQQVNYILMRFVKAYNDKQKQ